MKDRSQFQTVATLQHQQFSDLYAKIEEKPIKDWGPPTWYRNIFIIT
jgi:hypothetical protein